MTRVVITGMGAIAANGNGFENFVNNTLAGQVGIKPITKFDATETGITVAGQIDDFDAAAVVGKKKKPGGWIYTLNTRFKWRKRPWIWRGLMKRIRIQKTLG